MRGPRRAWLSHLKEGAVSQLPASASPADRAKLRSDVERALRGHGPDDPPLEIQDIVAMLVSEALGALKHAQRQVEQTERKAELITMGHMALEILLEQCPAYLVGTAGSPQRTQIARTLWHDLRTTLSRTLSGGEDEEHVIEVVTAHVTAWQRDHKRRWRLPSPAQVTKAIEATRGVVETVRHIPEVQQLATTVSQAVRERLRRRKSPTAPPTDPPPASS
jgi:hypothetical protein